MIDFAHARETMVDNQIITSSVTDRRLLAAMRRIPRERFVPEAARDLAYIDRALPLANGRSLSEPARFARLVQLAEIGPADRVLDAGCASGYSTAVLDALGGSVVGLEPDASVATAARANLAAVGAQRPIVVATPDEAGAAGSFDVVVVEDVVAAPPPELLALLRDGGRLVALVAEGRRPAVAHLFVRQGDDVRGTAGFNTPLQPSIKRADEPFVF